MKKNKGFTLIELLVVVAILGILASIVAISVAGAAIKSRDSRRKADLDVIKKAVSLYSIDNGFYPVGISSPESYAFCTSRAGSSAYMTRWNDIESKISKYLDQGSLPRDPKNSCPDTANTGDGKGTYTYITNKTSSTTASKFSVWTYLEYKKDTDSNSSGVVGALSKINETNGTIVLPSAKGKYKNTFYYAPRIYSITNNSDIEATYAVGTAN